MPEVFVTIKEKNNLYYLLKVIRRGLDVYCIPPHLGIHFSLHESGDSHFRFERPVKGKRDELQVALVMGEAGIPSDKGIIRAPLGELGRASGICTVIYPIDSLSKDFQEFKRSAGECFVIDTQLFAEGASGVEIGVWAVPERNKVSFEFNNPNIQADLLYKVTQCEPQVWIYARPFP